MNKQQWITESTLTDKQRQFKADYYNAYQSNRRKLNIVGGIISAAITYFVDIKVLHIDLQQPLTDNDKLYSAIIFLCCMFVFRLFRQQIQSRNVPQLPYGAEEKAVIDAMTPSQALNYIKADEQHQSRCKTGKHTSNAKAVILITAVIIALYYVKGV